jgi:hypothetical protein
VTTATPVKVSESADQAQQIKVTVEQSQQEFRLNPALAAFW